MNRKTGAVRFYGLAKIVAGLFGTVILVSSSSAIIINDGITVEQARDLAAQFPAVASTSFISDSPDISNCSSVLIAPDVILSAFHCTPDPLISSYLGPEEAVFGGDLNNPVFRSEIISEIAPGVSDPNAFRLLDGTDVVIRFLRDPVPASVAVPLRLISETDSLVGSESIVIGYGNNGFGSEVPRPVTADDTLWAGKNVIDSFGSPVGATGENIFSLDFDDGTNANNTIPGSSSTPLEFESGSAPGDSGSPLLVQVRGEWVIAGVMSGGERGEPAYGDVAWYTAIAQFRSEIAAAGGQFIPVIDFDADGIIGCDDVDQLVAEIVAGTNLGQFDVTGDGLVDGDDLDSWLVEAGLALHGGAIIGGDANLDGFVDASDFNIWNENKFTEVHAWCSGDFNADGAVDVTDFNVWNENKFTSSNVAQVPEPGGMAFCALLFGWLACCLRWRAGQ